jgi:lactoylglutathione lyase
MASDIKKPAPNIKQAVPFFNVSSMEASLRYYMDGLGFSLINQWTPRGKIEWCWLQRGGAAIMLQESRKENEGVLQSGGKKGSGVSICFICEDALALYREFIAHGIEARRPFVGNSMWVTILKDPDGYTIEFESVTDVAEETEYDPDKHF